MTGLRPGTFHLIFSLFRDRPSSTKKSRLSSGIAFALYVHFYEHDSVNVGFADEGAVSPEGLIASGPIPLWNRATLSPASATPMDEASVILPSLECSPVASDREARIEIRHHRVPFNHKTRCGSRIALNMRITGLDTITRLNMSNHQPENRKSSFRRV